MLAAVSGGADSVALAHVLARLAPEHGFTLAGIAHLNHGLRGDEADVDELFAGELARKLDVPFVSRRVDVAAAAESAGESLETAARRLRYAFLDDAATGLAAALVATGHTADDQAETVLMRLMRGAGLHGLSAIRPRNGIVIRPLLDARRSDVVAFLAEIGETWREDSSNADTAIARNRVRHAVMPALTSAGGDAVVDALARTASLIQDDADELDRVAIEMSRSVVLSGSTLDVTALEKAGPAIGRRVIRLAIENVAPSGQRRFLSLEHVEAVRSLIREDAPHAVQLPGVRAVREREVIRIEADGIEPPAPFETELPVPGTAEVPATGIVVSAELGVMAPREFAALDARADMVAVQGVASGEGARLTVRSRRPGDAIRPLGGPGRRKLQDVFVDRKVARHERDRVPLVVDETGRIIWVVGHTIADEFRVTSPEARVLLLKVRRVGGLG